MTRATTNPPRPPQPAPASETEANRLANGRKLKVLSAVLRVLAVAAAGGVAYLGLGSEAVGELTWVGTAVYALFVLVVAVAPLWSADHFLVGGAFIALAAGLVFAGYTASAPARWMSHELGAELGVEAGAAQEWTFSPDGDAGYSTTLFFAREPEEVDGAACARTPGTAATCPPSPYRADWYLLRGGDTLVTGTISDLTPPLHHPIVAFHAWAGTVHRLRVEVRVPDPGLREWRPQLTVSLDRDSMRVYSAAVGERNLALLVLLTAALTLSVLGIGRVRGQAQRRHGGQARISTAALRRRPRWEGQSTSSDGE